MSVRTDVVNLIVNVNSNQAQNQLNELRKKAIDGKLAMDGLKKGTEEYAAKKKELGEINKAMDDLKKQIGFTSLSQKELNQELTKLKALKGSVQPFTAEFHELQKQIETVESRLYDVRNGVQGFSSFLSKISGEVKQFGLLAVGTLGFQFISSQFQNIISGAGKLSDQLADIRRVTGLSANEVAHLNKELTALDTRTSTEGLRNIAIVAGKLGVAKEDILGFVKATDMLVVALGDELGDADQITTQLGKIINVFDKGDGKVTGEKLTNIGNAIVDLANKGVATGGFIVDFTQRLAGLAKNANLALPDVLALGAGLEESGQKVESSATAIVKVMGQIGADVPKFAAVAGKSIEEFSKTLKEKPVEAIIQVSEGFTKGKNSFEEISKAFAGAGEDGAKIVSTLGVIGGKAEFFRKKVEETTIAIIENGEVTGAFALKNENLGAILDKISKEFNKLMVSSAVNDFLKGAAEGLYNFLLFLKDLPNWLERNRTALIAITGVILMYVAAKSKAIIAATLNRIAIGLETAADKLEAAEKIVLTAVTKAYAFAKGVLTGKIELATAAQIIYNNVLKANPIVAIIAIITAFAVAVSWLTSKYSELTAQQRINNELQKRVIELTADEEAKARVLFNTLQNNNLGYDAKKKLLADLVAINPQYLKGLTAENIKTQEGVAILEKYVAQLRESNRIKAEQEIILEKEKKRVKLNSKLDQLKNAPDIKGNLLKDLGAQIGIGDGSSGYQFIQAQQQLKKLDSELKLMYDDSEKNIKKTVEDGSNKGVASIIDQSLKAELERLQTQKEVLEIARGQLGKDNIKGDLANLKQQEDIQKRIDFLNGKKEKKESGENKAAALRKQFDELMGKLNITEAKATMDELEVKFAQINEKLKQEQELISKALAAGAISPNEAKAAMARILKVAIEEFDKAAIDFKNKLAKKRGLALTLHIGLKPLDETIAQQPIKDSIGVVGRILAKMTRDEKAKLQIDVLTNPIGSNKNTNGQIGLLELEKKEKLKNADLTENEILEIETDYAQRKLKVKMQAFQAYADFAVKGATTVNNLLNAIENRQVQKETAANDKKKRDLQKQLTNKLISQEQFNLKTIKLDDELDKKKRQLAHDQAKRQKAIDIAAGLSSTALAVIGFLSAKPVGPWNFIQAAIAGAVGLAQVATIATTPLPELGVGGFVRTGDKHSDSSGGINAKIERDEAVINAKTMTDANIYSLTGTPAQITSTLNGKGGGVTWAIPAIEGLPKWRTEQPAQINPRIPKILALGGVAYANQSVSNNRGTTANNTDVSSNTGDDMPKLLQQILNEQKRNNDKMNEWATKLQVVFSQREYERFNSNYDNARKQSSISR